MTQVERESQTSGPVLTRKRLLIVAAAAYLVFLVAFGFMAATADEFPGEADVSDWVQSWRTSWLDTTMKGISAPGSTMVALPLSLAVLAGLFVYGRRIEAVVVLVATGSSTVMNSALKEIIARPRPTSDVVEVLQEFDGFSFPSGHVTYYVVFLGTLVAVLTSPMAATATRTLILVLAAMTLLAIGVSRIYLGAHYWADVVGGYALGAAVVAVSVVIHRLVSVNLAQHETESATLPNRESVTDT
ncbi:MAG: phosphatase PAP2 family protein [Chloroflexi bacterium]|nr:phosphatase PAP2 family protein [Chloroflexota bacterium]